MVKADLAIGASGEDVGTVPDAGVVNVAYGSSSGLTIAFDQRWDLSDLGGTVQNGDHFQAM